MKSTSSGLVQSKYFNPAFNSAIFDGPIRIYFAQFHESLALKIYFSLQQSLEKELKNAKNFHRTSGRNVMVLLYPTAESFQDSFDSSRDFLLLAELGDDDIIGINGSFEDEKLGMVIENIRGVLSLWDESPINDTTFAQAQP